MIGRTNVGGMGGGGGSDWSSGIIHVYAPAGSAITATKGLITKIAIEHPVIGQNSEYFIYIGPEDFGAWSVNAALPSSRTKSETVTVSSNIMYFVEFKDALLPEEYQQVEYIQSSGTQYINTGRNLRYNDELELTAALTATTPNAYIFAGNTPNPVFGFYTESQKISCFLDGLATTNYSPSTSTHTYKAIITSNGTGNTLWYDDNLIRTANRDLWGNCPVSLCYSDFTLTGVGKGQMKIYSYTVKNRGTLISEFIPCYRKSDSVVGMYDIKAASDAFHINAGTGSFTVGPDVN